MRRPDHSPDEALKGKSEDEPAVPKNQGPRFDELMMLVFSGPMCFECGEEDEAETEDESAGAEQESDEES